MKRRGCVKVGEIKIAKFNKRNGFALIEVVIAAFIFLVIVVSILGLAQIEGNAITSLWRSSYYDTALMEVGRMIEGCACDKLVLINDEILIQVGREKIAVEVIKAYEERVTGRLMWTIVLKISGERKNNTIEVKRYCP